jgi:outer membrane immunogenic protein
MQYAPRKDKFRNKWRSRQVIVKDFSKGYATLKTVCMALVLVLLPLSARAQGASAATHHGFDWTGYYGGIHAGWLRADADYSEPDYPGFEIHPKFNGFNGGLLAGYIRQFNLFVVGLGVDGGLGTAKHGANGTGGNGYSALNIKWNAHFRGRLGFTLPARTLVFATFGLAVAKLQLNDVDPGFGKDAAYLTGWTLGGGIEHAFDEHHIVRLEYLYDDYGQANFSIGSPPSSVYFPSYRARTHLKAQSVRAAIVWLF